MESNLRAPVSPGEVKNISPWHALPKKISQSFILAVHIVLARTEMNSAVAQDKTVETKKLPPLPQAEIESLTAQMGHDHFPLREEAYQKLQLHCTDVDSLLILSQGFTAGDAEIRQRTKGIIDHHKDVLLKAFPRQPRSDDGFIPLDINFFIAGNPQLPPIHLGAEKAKAHELRRYYLHKARGGGLGHNFTGAYECFLDEMHAYHLDRGLKDPHRQELYKKWKEQFPAKEKRDFLRERVEESVATGSKEIKTIVRDMDIAAQLVPIHIRKFTAYMER